MYSALSICTVHASTQYITTICATASWTLSIFALDCRGTLLIQGWQPPPHHSTPILKKPSPVSSAAPLWGLLPRSLRGSGGEEHLEKQTEVGWVIYSQRGSAADHCHEGGVDQRTAGSSGGKWSASQCMTHENIMNRSQGANPKYTHTHIHRYR